MIDLKDFNLGDIVQHKLSNDWLMIVSIDCKYGTCECRMKNLRKKEFYDYELIEKQK